MNDHVDPDPSEPSGPSGADDHHDRHEQDDDGRDPVLAAAGARLRQGSTPISAQAVEIGVLRRRARRTGLLAAASVAVIALLGGLLVVRDGSTGDTVLAGGPSSARIDRLVASLPDRPVDPTEVELVSTVSTFADCDALIGDLREVGARHVGSRGFGAYGDVVPGVAYDEGRGAPAGVTTQDTAASMGTADGAADAAGAGQTLGTNVQVLGVDELDFVKADGTLVYDLDGKGNLRITDAGSLRVLSTLDVTPGPEGEPGGDRVGPVGPPRVTDLLVAGGRLVVFGSEYEVSAPVKGDPSATTATTAYLTVTFVDATDPAHPEVTDRVRVEGSLVSARLVKGQVRLVTTANMADLGFVTPTTAASVAKALEVNRRSVAASTAADWIPYWQRNGSDARPLVPCQRVHVPDTFSGVAMTSMVTFPLGAGRFEPAATSILAPGSTLYAGPDRVAISSEVWVDPIDRDRLRFDDWKTAVHEFTFAAATDGADRRDRRDRRSPPSAPSYEGSGIVDGSTIGQFAFGEVGDSVAVVTTRGTPWNQDPERGVDLTVLSPDGRGALSETAKVADLARGDGGVEAVRFVDGRVLVSTGSLGRDVHVIDVSDPARPRRAGRVAVPGTVGYFHPLPGHRALIVGSRHDRVGDEPDARDRSWVTARLLDVADPDAPRIVASWERPWASDDVGSDHHAFTYWPGRRLAMWGVHDARWEAGEQDPDRPNHAVVLGTGGGLTEVAVPAASRPPEVPAPCPVVEVTDPEVRRMVGPGGVVLRCSERSAEEIEWPRYRCYAVDDTLIARYAPTERGRGVFFLCSPADPPRVARVLVVSGRPVLFTDQTLETLDPATFRSTRIAYHPTGEPYWPRAVP